MTDACHTSTTEVSPKSNLEHCNGPPAPIENPFHGLSDGTWLHDRPNEEVYKLLIDTYRLRMNDRYRLEGSADSDCIHGGAPNSHVGFRRFLDKVEEKGGLLPSWWSGEKVAECQRTGVTMGWSSLAVTIGEGEIVAHYRDSNMPMQMRTFGEQIYGRALGGESADTKMLMLGLEDAGEMIMPLLGFKVVGH
ncbi:hypothetical protein BDW59DRAFT_161214 [Aspergillus cavernicola]|uniref:Uncharacterized protein n=1 Tax=Aspergillus cavernicola TaxID=176166 RepID=A0ABR4IEB6_9EURO